MQPHRRRSPRDLAATALLVVLIVGLLVVGLRTFGKPAGGPVTPPERPILAPQPLTIEALRELPGVAGVTVTGQQQKPSHRIIHILNWHALELEHFAADLLASGEEPAGEWGLEQSYDEHLPVQRNGSTVPIAAVCRTDARKAPRTGNAANPWQPIILSFGPAADLARRLGSLTKPPTKAVGCVSASSAGGRA